MTAPWEGSADVNLCVGSALDSAVPSADNLPASTPSIPNPSIPESVIICSAETAQFVVCAPETNAFNRRRTILFKIS